MLQYIENIIVSYVEKVREVVGTEKAALVIIDNFKGQITTAVNNLLEQNILVCLLPTNTTDLLRPMDIAKRKFEQWYSEEVMQQLERRGPNNLEAAELKPIQLGMQVMKEVGAKWLVELADYISNSPEFLVNGFIHSGITGAIVGIESNTDNNYDNNSDYGSDYISSDASNDDNN